MIKNLVLMAVLLCVPVQLSWAGYTSTVKILENKEIVKLTDEELTNTYMDALVEVQARKDFFNRFGFASKDLEDYKSMLKYRLVLLMEIHIRNIDIPQFERY